MLFHIGKGLDCRIHFSYENRATKCVVELSDTLSDKTPIKRFSGVTICHKSDNFCKRIGRKHALARAVALLPRPTRSLIWNAYHHRGGNQITL